MDVISGYDLGMKIDKSNERWIKIKINYSIRIDLMIKRRK